MLACTADEDTADTAPLTISASGTGIGTGTASEDTGPATTSDAETSATATGTGTTAQATTWEETTGDATTGPVATTTGDDTSGDGTTGDDTSGDGTTGEPAALSWALDVHPVAIANSCGGCHASGLGGLWMTGPEDSYENLVGAKSWQSDLRLVEPGAADSSYLLYKLRGTQGELGSGGSMPLNMPMLPQSSIDLIEQWIAEGALP